MKRFSFSMMVLLVASTAWGDFDTIGPNGINSDVTGLTGDGIEIGEVDGLRSGMRLHPFTGEPYDADQFSASNTRPVGVFFQTNSGFDPPNNAVGEHATKVAGVIISTDEFPPCAICDGVAPDADLYSIGVGELTDDPTWALSLNRILRLSGVTLRATNTSGGGPIQAFESPNGLSHLTQYYDWSASRFNVLHVVAWGNNPDVDPDSFPERKPADQYNGLTVGGSMRPMGDTKYRAWWDGNATTGYAQSADIFGGNFEERPSIHLIAPAEGVAVVGWNNVIDVAFVGTSSATAHVTGAAALLHQYSNENFILTPNSRRHEVIKAVLMTSADKLSGVHGSNRDVVNMNGATFGGESMQNSLFFPLDRDIGAGHLNVKRALDLYKSDEQDPGIVPKMGWDYNTIGGTGSEVEYIFSSSGSGFIAATLTWDRRVELTDPDNTYSAGDDFFDRPYYQELNNLDLYLIDKNQTEITLANSEHASIAQSGNFEHIFFNVGAGEYKLVVKHGAGAIGDSQNYGLAWWFGNPSPPGDYDGNGSVGPEDFNVWREDFATSVSAGTGADGNGNGTVDAADYVVWRKFATGSGAAASDSDVVPEPVGLILFAAAIPAFLCCQRRSELSA
ncbi:MAG: S8 family serine peptidase [Planctomycetes bacterium]|nr:S8 family serine peptidase [Planctomycetota bacterium]